MSKSTVKFCTYQEWERQVDISPVSPEAYFAELAWNAAVVRMADLVAAARDAEPTKERLAVLLQEELVNLDTGFRGEEESEPKVDPVRNEDGSIKNFMLRIEGKPYRCKCGANVFVKPFKQNEKIYECNGCGTRLESE